jgi:hypothetical protein
MTQAIQIHSPRDELVAIAERASLFALLQQTLRRQRIPQELPGRLYDDLGISQVSGPISGRTDADGTRMNL